MSKPLKIFITYSHKNTKEKDELITRLARLEHEGIIEIWHDNEILPGDNWRDAIFSNLADSELLLYLTSAYSLESENCNKELATALTAEKRFVPIILEHCDWKRHKLEKPQSLSAEGLHLSESEFQMLGDIQALPARGKPLNEWRPRSTGWESVVEGIRKTVRKMQSETVASEAELRAESEFRHGNTLMMLGQLDMAIEAYSHVINLSPRDVDAYNNRGIAYSIKGEVDLAIKNFNTAIGFCPDYPEVYNSRGNAHSKKGNFTLAIRDYTKAIKLNPEFANAYYNRGTAYGGEGEFNKAIEDFSMAIRLRTTFAKAYYNRGVAYRDKKDIKHAIKDFNKAIQVNPNFAEAYYNRGTIYGNKGEFDKAIKDFNVVIKLDSGFVGAYANRGAAYNDKGEFDKAIKDFEKAIKLNPKLAEAYVNRGNVYSEKDQFDKAIEDYNIGIKLKPTLAETYANRGNAYNRKGEFDKAIEDYNIGIKLKPTLAEAYYGRGNVYHHKGEFDKAIKDYNMVIKLNSNFPDAYNNRGVAYIRIGDVKRAIKDYSMAIQLKSDAAGTYCNRGEAWLHLQEWNKAKADLIMAKRMGMDIIASFRNDYKNVEAFEQQHRVKLPKDIGLLLTQHRRSRYPKTQGVLDADGNPLESPDVINLRSQLRNAGTPLGEYINTKPAFGINITPTEAFVIDKTTRDKFIVAHRSSADILKPFLHGRDLRRWHVDTPNQWLIFAHRGIAINDYPAILKHLEKYRESLGKRKGKQAWYELQASTTDTERFAQPKLVCPNFYNHQTFAVDTAGYYYGNTSYLIPTEEVWLCGLLNSRTVEWFYSQVSDQLTGDELRARSGYMQQIPVPNLTSERKTLIAKIVDYLIYLQQQPTTNSKDLKHARDAIMLGYFERIIDGLVYEAYLSEELHQSNKYFFQPLLDEQLPSFETVQGDKMSVFRDIFELLYERTHPIRRNLFFLDSVKSVRIIEGKL